MKWYVWLLIAIAVAILAYLVLGWTGLLAAPVVAAAGKDAFINEVQAVQFVQYH